MNIKKSKIKFHVDDFKVIGIVSNSKEYKIAWILNTLLNINLKKSDNILIKLVNNQSISVSCLNYKDKDTDKDNPPTEDVSSPAFSDDDIPF